MVLSLATFTQFLFSTHRQNLDEQYFHSIAQFSINIKQDTL